MKKNISLFLGIIIIILCLLPACIEKPVENKPVTDNISQSDISESADDTIAPPSLDPVDYDGYQFNVLISSGDTLRPAYEMSADEQNGEPINDAVYTRNTQIEDKYNISIIVHTDNVISKLRSSVLADDNSYDIAMPTVCDAFALAMNEALYEMNSLPNTDYSKPWWNQNIKDQTSIGGMNYFMGGDMNLQTYDGIPAVLFNKNMAENFDLGDIYEIFNNGGWTFDIMNKMNGIVSGDIDGDGQMTISDQYGMTITGVAMDAFLFGADVKLIAKDNDDIPIVNFNNEKTFNVIEKISIMCSDDNVVLNGAKGQTGGGAEIPKQTFSEGRALFWIETLSCVTWVREMEIDFGILTLPKFDEAQENYSSSIHVFCSSTVVIPASANDIDRTGRIVEDMMYMSWLYIRPEYIDVALTGKYFRDSESADTLDILLANPSCDLANTMRNSNLTIMNDLRKLIVDSNLTIASTYAANENKYIAKVQELTDIILKAKEG